MKRKRIIRTYYLLLYPNQSKRKLLRYGIHWQRTLTLQYIERMWHSLTIDRESTASLGAIADWAQKRARDIMVAGWASYEATGIPFQCPRSAPALQDARIRENKTSKEFDYWVKPVLGPWVPAKSHKALNKALRSGGYRIRRADLEAP